MDNDNARGNCLTLVPNCKGSLDTENRVAKMVQNFKLDVLSAVKKGVFAAWQPKEKKTKFSVIIKVVAS